MKFLMDDRMKNIIVQFYNANDENPRACNSNHLVILLDYFQIFLRIRTIIFHALFSKYKSSIQNKFHENFNQGI